MRAVALTALLLGACTADNPEFDPVSRSCVEHGFPSPTCDSYREANGLSPAAPDMSTMPDLAPPPDLLPPPDLVAHMWHDGDTCLPRGAECAVFGHDDTCCRRECTGNSVNPNGLGCE